MFCKEYRTEVMILSILRYSYVNDRSVFHKCVRHVQHDVPEVRTGA
jgi:hypothetical protein